MLNLSILRKAIHDIRPFSLSARHLSLHANTAHKRLEGKVAMITGGASGIGYAIARVFTKEGAKVVIADIQGELGREVKEELGPCVEYVQCDVAEEAHVSAAVDFAISKHGALDIMCNNAGVCGGGVGPVSGLDMGEFAKVMEVNVAGVLSGVKHAARVMVPARKGRILCTGSINGVMAVGLNHPYTIAKHAVLGIVKSAAAELGRHGITVNCISPYMVATPMLLSFFRQFNPGVTMELITQKFCQPNSAMEGVILSAEDVAMAALFLASEDGRFVNGHNLVVDGGFTVSKELTLREMNDLWS